MVNVSIHTLNGSFWTLDKDTLIKNIYTYNDSKCISGDNEEKLKELLRLAQQKYFLSMYNYPYTELYDETISFILEEEEAELRWLCNEKRDELEILTNLIKEFTKKNLDKEKIKIILYNMFPKFAFYTFDCLKIFKINQEKTYSISKLTSLKENLYNTGFEVLPEEVDAVLQNNCQSSKENSRVLKLANKVNDLFK